MTKTDEIIAEILRTVERDLRQHAFSEKHYPSSVTVRTEYRDCTQILHVDLGKEKSI